VRPASAARSSAPDLPLAAAGMSNSERVWRHRRSPLDGPAAYRSTRHDQCTRHQNKRHLKITVAGHWGGNGSMALITQRIGPGVVEIGGVEGSPAASQSAPRCVPDPTASTWRCPPVIPANYAFASRRRAIAASSSMP
jgi:hypothetical protein